MESERGISVYWISTCFVQEIEDCGYDVQAPVHELEDFSDAKNTGFIRRKGRDISCPRDHELGSSYIDAIVVRGGEKDIIGPAKFALICSRNNSIRDIADGLITHCDRNKMNPKETYVWVDFLCLNLHRMSDEYNVSKFPNRLGIEKFVVQSERKKKVQVLALFSPWYSPYILGKAMSIYSLFYANDNDCTLQFCLTSEERMSMLRTVLFTSDGLNDLLEVVRGLDIMKAETYSENEKDYILRSIDKGGQTVEFVNAWVKDWVKDKIVDELFSGECKEIGSLDDIDRVCHGLGNIYHAEKNLDQAYRLFQKSLSIRERKPNKEKDIASACRNIGLVLQDLDDLEGSLLYFKKSIQLRQKNVNTIETSDCFTNAGDVQFVLKDFSGALDSYNAACSIEKKIHGLNHSRTATCFHNLGKVLSATGKSDGAISYFQQSLVTREEILGKNHVDTASTYTCIGQALTKKESHSEALDNYMISLKIHKELHGDNDSGTALAYNNVAMAHCDLGAYADALKYLERSIEIYEKILGEQHPHTVVARESLRDIEALRDQVLTV